VLRGRTAAARGLTGALGEEPGAPAATLASELAGTTARP
jgi:hypothetical protein